MVDFTQYQPPGVYVQDTTTPLISTTGSDPSAICIIGASIGYQTFSEAITLIWNADGDPDPIGVPVALTQRGAYLSGSSGGTAHHNAAIPAPIVTKVSDGTVLTEGTDYSLSLDTTGGGGVANGVAYITPLLSADGIAVVVVYNYADSSYTATQVFTDFDDLAAVYGVPLVQTSPANPNASQVNSPLSLAAQIAFQNGAGQVLTVALDPSQSNLRDAFQSAYDQIETDSRVGIVVPILMEVSPTTATTTLANTEQLAEDLDTAVNNATNEGFPRIGIFGVCAGLQNTGATGAAGQADFIAVAASVADQRAVMAYPNALNLYNGNTNQTIVVDGAFLAAAYAGQLSANGVEQGLTRETINSFTGIPATIQQLQTKTFKDALSKGGVAVTEINRQNVLVCRHGVSTDMTSVLTREVSVTRQNDALYYLLLDGIDAAGLIGSPITLGTVLAVKGVVTGILEAAVNNQIIVDYQDAAVRQQALPSGDPTAIEVKFAWLPALPLNYIVVSFAIDLNTGDYTDLTTTSTTNNTAASTVSDDSDDGS